MKNLNVIGKISVAGCMLGLLGVAGIAAAGQKVTQSVTAHSSYIFGNLADARNSASAIEMLEIRDYGTYMYITGVMASGSMGGCTTSNATAMAQLRAAKSDAQVRANIASGTCTNVYVANSSWHAPKNP